MKTVNVSVKGMTSFLQHRFSEMSENNDATRATLVTRGTPREEAEKFVYRDSEGRYYFPGVSIARSIAEAASNHKLKGSRKSARFVVPAAMIVREDAIILCGSDGVTPMPDFEVDSRPVTIPATKGRIIRHRPRFDGWTANFSLLINDSILPTDSIHRFLDEAGACVGVGDFRPSKGGPFGTFLVTKWEE